MKLKLLTLFALLMSVQFAIAQRTVTGTLTDAETNDPLIGANVVVNNSDIGTITDVDGSYSIALPDGAESYSLTFSYTGYASQTIENVQPGVLNLQLSQGSVLDEVVVVGYTSQKKGNITGAISVVDVESISKTPYSNVLQALQGKVSGIQLTQDGQPGSGRTNIKIRGGNDPQQQ